MQRVGGARRKSRHKLRKNYRARGKTPLRDYLQTFEVGERVILAANSTEQGGMYCLRFHGHVGIVSGKQGSCYRVVIVDGNKSKSFVVNPVHLRRIVQ